MVVNQCKVFVSLQEWRFFLIKILFIKVCICSWAKTVEQYSSSGRAKPWQHLQRSKSMMRIHALTTILIFIVQNLIYQFSCIQWKLIVYNLIYNACGANLVVYILLEFRLGIVSWMFREEDFFNYLVASQFNLMNYEH